MTFKDLTDLNKAEKELEAMKYGPNEDETVKSWAQKAESKAEDIKRLKGLIEEEQEALEQAKRIILDGSSVYPVYPEGKTLCWCDMRIGNPMVSEHSERCNTARDWVQQNFPEDMP